MKILDNIRLSEAKILLGDILQYADMTKKLGIRGRILFHKTFSGKEDFVVEYFPAFGEEESWKQAQSVYKKTFHSSPNRIDVKFIPREDIKGGMKVYMDDHMVDLSFRKVENLLQK